MTSDATSTRLQESMKRNATRRAVAALVSICALFLAACGGESNTNSGASNTGAANRNQPTAGQPGNQNSASATANANQNTAPTPTGPNPVAVIDTDAGTIKVEVLMKDAPVTADNFVQLAKRGFYNNLIFHRVISGFMIQGGDPRGNGTGGETASGRPLPNEINLNSPLYQGGYKRGLVAMANAGSPESGRSQFFIMHQNYPLPPKYTIFGRVVEGMNVVDKIATAPVNGERPVTPVKTKTVTIQ